MTKFMQPGDIDISTMLSTTDWPTCTAAETHIVGDYNSVQVTVSGEEEGEESGVYFYLCDEEKCIFVEVFSGPHNSCVLKLVDGKWVSDDQTITRLQETNRQLVAENERRSAEIANLKHQLRVATRDFGDPS